MATYTDALVIEREAPGPGQPLIPGDPEKLAGLKTRSFILDSVRICCGFVKAASSMPMTSRPETSYQWGVWLTYLLGSITEAGLLLGTGKKRWSPTLLTGAKGALKLVVAITAFALESVVCWQYETKATDLDQGDVALKYTQNIGYLIADGTGAFAALPIGKGWQLGLSIVSVFFSAATVVFNLARIGLNYTNGILHLNF